MSPSAIFDSFQTQFLSDRRVLDPISLPRSSLAHCGELEVDFSFQPEFIIRRDRKRLSDIDFWNHLSEVSEIRMQSIFWRISCIYLTFSAQP